MSRPVSLFNCFLVPVIVLLIGIILSGLYAFRTIPDAFKDAHRGVTPPKFSLTLDEAKRYSLWIYSKGIYEGETYETGEELPAGARVHVIDSSTGDFLPMNNWLKQTKSLGRESAFLIGTFETGIANQEIQVMASGLDKPVVVGISEKNMSDMVNVFLGIFGIFVISLFIAIGILVVMLHRRKKQVMETVLES